MSSDTDSEGATELQVSVDDEAFAARYSTDSDALVALAAIATLADIPREFVVDEELQRAVDAGLAAGEVPGPENRPTCYQLIRTLRKGVCDQIRLRDGTVIIVNRFAGADRVTITPATSLPGLDADGITRIPPSLPDADEEGKGAEETESPGFVTRLLGGGRDG